MPTLATPAYAGRSASAIPFGSYKLGGGLNRDGVPIVLVDANFYTRRVHEQ